MVMRIDRQKTRGALLAAFIVLVAALALLLLGRTPFGPTGRIGLWSGETQSQFNSQRLFDAYSFTHILHGLGFYLLFWFFRKRLSLENRFVLTILLESAWEVLENTDLIINRYRAETLSLHYYGDSVINSVSDILVAAVGYFLAARLPVRASVALLLLVEGSLILLIRDSLFLNALLLICPIPAIRHWQLGQ